MWTIQHARSSRAGEKANGVTEEGEGGLSRSDALCGRAAPAAALRMSTSNGSWLSVGHLPHMWSPGKCKSRSLLRSFQKNLTQMSHRNVDRQNRRVAVRAIVLSCGTPGIIKTAKQPFGSFPTSTLYNAPSNSRQTHLRAFESFSSSS